VCVCVCVCVCRVSDVVEVLSSCGLSVTDMDNVTNESLDIVSDQLVSPQQVCYTRSCRYTCDRKFFQR